MKFTWNQDGKKSRSLFIRQCGMNHKKQYNFFSDAYLKYARPYAVQKIKDEL